MSYTNIKGVDMFAVLRVNTTTGQWIADTDDNGGIITFDTLALATRQAQDIINSGINACIVVIIR